MSDIRITYSFRYVGVPVQTFLKCLTISQSHFVTISGAEHCTRNALIRWRPLQLLAVEHVPAQPVPRVLPGRYSCYINTNNACTLSLLPEYLPKGPVDATRMRNFAEARLAQLKADQELVNDKYKFIAHLESITGDIIGMNKHKVDLVNSGNNKERSNNLVPANPFSLPQVIFNTDSINSEDYKLPCNDSLAKLKQLRESLNRFNVSDANANNDEKRVSFVYPSEDKIDTDQFRNIEPIDARTSSKPLEFNLDTDYNITNSGKFAVGGIISTENAPKSNYESIPQPKFTDEIDFSGNWKGSKGSNTNSNRYPAPFTSGGSSVTNKSLDLSGLSTEKLKEINAKFSS